MLARVTGLWQVTVELRCYCWAAHWQGCLCPGTPVPVAAFSQVWLPKYPLEIMGRLLMSAWKSCSTA